MRLRAELRSRWRAWLALALIFGIGSGASIAALAAARRTDTAYPRFVAAQDGFDAYTGGGGEDGFEQRFAELKSHPAAVSAEEVIIVGGSVTIPARRGREEIVVGIPDALVVANPSGRVLYETNRAKVLEGRLARKTEPHEVVVPFTARDRYGVRVGDHITVGIGFTDEFEPAREVPVRVVGIVAAPGDFEAVGQTLFLALYGTPAMFEMYGDLVPVVPDLWNLGFHLRGGSDAAVAFKQSVEREFNIDVPVIEPVIRSGVQKTIRLYAVALWVVGALIAVATVAIVGQTLARQTTLESSDHPVLRALGFSPGRMIGLTMLRTSLIGLTAAVVAAVVAYLASPLFPIGPARTAEPSPGFSLDATVVGLGAVTVILLVPLITLVPSIRAARAAAATDLAIDATRTPRIVQAASRIFRSPATAAGLRMALEPGRGRAAVPIRSTILAVALGIAAVTGSVVVGESLTNLIDSPDLAGFTYDALLPGDLDEPDPVVEAQRVATLRQLPFVDRLTSGTALNIVVGGADSFLLAFDEDGEIDFAVIDGRSPTDAPQGGLPEIALGAATMRRLKLSIGDVVEFGYPPEESERDEGEGPEPELLRQRARIVGVVAVPPLPFAVTEPGEGALMTLGAVSTFNPDHGGGCCYVAFKDGITLDEAKAGLQEAGFGDVFPRTERADLAVLERISRLPILLSIIFAVIAAAALTHVLVTAVRRRRRELAILKTLGFVQRQVRTAVAWQVSTIAVLAAAVGIPAGIALGRWGWGLVAAHFAVVPVPVAPLLILVLIAPAALLLGNVVAAIPARFAARTQPAIVLRTE
jgi:hypothetical protein